MLVTGRSLVLLALLVTFVAACGDRRLAADDAGVLDSAPTIDASAHQDTATPDQRVTPPTGEGCVVAIRVDDCCTAPQPVPASALANDPCLVPVPQGPIPAACKAKWRPECAMIDCDFVQAPSRVARPTKPAGGACGYADECQTANDCVVATDRRHCCACPGVYPKALLPYQPCITQEGTKPGASCPPLNCPDVLCAPCGTPLVACVEGVDGLRTCTVRKD